MERGASELAAELANKALLGPNGSMVSVPVASAAIGEAQASIRFGADVLPALAEGAGPRRSAVISAGRRVSFADLLQRVPGQLLAPVDHGTSVTLRIRLAGESTIVLYRSTARGSCYARDDQRHVRRARDDPAHPAADPVH